MSKALGNSPLSPHRLSSVEVKLDLKNIDEKAEQERRFKKILKAVESFEFAHHTHKVLVNYFSIGSNITVCVRVCVCRSVSVLLSDNGW